MIQACLATALLAALSACTPGESRPQATAEPAAARASAATLSAEPTITTLSVMRADDSEIIAHVERAETGSPQSILLVLQGSICASVGPAGDDRMELELPPGLARLDIEKYGLGSPGAHSVDGCPEIYLRNNTVDQRVFDVLVTIAHLRRSAPWWNGRLFLMGTSEGATVAALAGPLMPETAGIVLVNGSIGRPFREGWADAMAASVAAAGADEATVAATRDEAERVWGEARSTPRWDQQEFGEGNTLKWWASIIDLRPSNLLFLTRAPILLVQADHDEMTPVASARAVRDQFAERGLDNLTYVELEDLTHGLRTLEGEPGWEPVLALIRAWLDAQNGTAAESRALRR